MSLVCYHCRQHILVTDKIIIAQFGGQKEGVAIAGSCLPKILGATRLYPDKKTKPLQGINFFEQICVESDPKKATYRHTDPFPYGYYAFQISWAYEEGSFLGSLDAGPSENCFPEGWKRMVLQQKKWSIN